MDYRDYIEVLGRRKWLIVVSFVAVFLGVVVYLVVTPPLYKSTTTILVNSQQVPNSFIQSTVTTGIEDRLATIVQQVTSRTRLIKVRKELGFFAEDGEKQGYEEAYISTMKDRIEINILQDTNSVGRGSGSKEGFSLTYIDEDPKLAMLTASKLASLFIEENQKTRERQAVGTSKLIESQLKETKANLTAQEEKINRYKMRYLGELPQELQTNLAKQTNLQDQLRMNASEIQGKENRIVLLRSQISAIERGPLTIVQKGGREEVDTSRDSAQALVTDLTNRRNQLAELTAKYTEQHPDVIRLRQEVAQLEKKMAMTYMPPRTSNPNEKDGSISSPYLPLGGREREEILSLRAQVASTEAEIDALKRDRETIQGRIAVLQAKLNNVPRHEQELIGLTRDYDNLKNLYNDLLKKKMEANIAEDQENRQKEEQFQILDPAYLPRKPFKPDMKKVLLIALLLASGLGFGGALLLEEADQTIRGVKDFQNLFDIKVFACIPDIDEGAHDRGLTFQVGVLLAGGLLCLAGVLALLWFYEEQIRILLKM